MQALLSLLLAISVLWKSALATHTYTIFMPKYVRPGIPTKFTAEIVQNENPVLLSAKLYSADFESTVTEVINSGERRTLEFVPIPLGYEGNTEFRVKITGNDSVTGVQLFQNETQGRDIDYQQKFISIFIQTDKAIYQPSHTIKFRAVVTTPDLLPYDGYATYKLTDPDSNVIMQEADAPLVNGVVGSQYTLGRYSTTGDWKITYEVHGFEESLSVTVEEYKLPKFKVEVDLDKTYLHPGSSHLSGRIKGTYTFGQPVKGRARILVRMPYSGRRGTPNEFEEPFSDFDGVHDFAFTLGDIKKRLGWTDDEERDNYQYYYTLQITAFVTDKNTGDELNGTATVNMVRTPIKVEAVAHPESNKPGLPYTAYVKITKQDNTLLTTSERNSLMAAVRVEYSYPYNYTADAQQQEKEETLDLVVRDDGIAVINIVAEADNFERIFFNVLIKSIPRDVNDYWASWEVQRFKSPSDTFMQVSTESSSVAVGEIADLNIHTTAQAEMYTIMILSRGKLIKTATVTPSSYETAEHSSLFHYNLYITNEMIPNVYAVVSFVRSDGEVIGDSIKMNVQASLKNKVTITSSSNTLDAGMPVSITIQADGSSFVGLRAIDQSVLLLKEGNDITQTKVFADLDKYGTQDDFWNGWGGFPWFCWYYPIQGRDVSDIFENSGVLVFTDAWLYSSDYFGNHYLESAVMFDGGAELFPMAAEVLLYKGEASTPSSEPIKTRSYFPETWIWADGISRADGTITFEYNTPDTITTWEISSFAVSAAAGLGVTKENSKITVFRNFFISLDLPPSMVRGEILSLKTTLFNYFETDLPVTVTLNLNQWYDLIYIGNDPAVGGPERTLTIPSKDSTTVVFPIQMKKAGLARISVTARSSLAGDAVDRTLVVKPEGVPEVVSHSTIVERSEGDEPTFLEFDVEIPDNVVDGSTFNKFAVSGNILGNALSNLGDLLKMPSGCGEQTMLNFAPDVYISLYLKEVGELTGEIKQKSKSHIQQGYQNELRYKREDGSFSAFGSSDPAGSTWLTAFVVKCFIAAAQLDVNLVERTKIDHAMEFIVAQQVEPETVDEDAVVGWFADPGRVIHSQMQGGATSRDTRTAYVLIAIAEGGYFKDDPAMQGVMRKAQYYLEDRLVHLKDPYTLAIMAYALALVESEHVEAVMATLDSAATAKGNLRYWKKEQTGASKCMTGNYCSPTQESSSSEIEMTAYVLLTYIKLGRVDEVMPIVRWLIQQRGAFGGYHSTQDTVMAIQALATVAGLFSNETTDLSLVVTHDADLTFEERFTVNDENSIVLQMADLPRYPGIVTIKATGQGFADVQLSTMYNLPTEPRSDDPIVLNVDVLEGDGVVTLDICAKINEDRDEIIDSTGMFVVSVDLPSGHTVDDKKMTKDNKAVKLVELDGEVVTGYFDELTLGVTSCMELELVRYADVSGGKPQLIQAYDYYKPSRRAMRQYQPKTTSLCLNAEICALCGDACAGCSEEVDLCYDPMSHLAEIIEEYSSDSLCPTSSTQRCSYLEGDTFGDGEAGCSDSAFSTSLNSDDGFTMTFLIYPTELSSSKKYTIFTIVSDASEDAHVLLEKKENANVFGAKFLLRGFKCTVDGIPITDVPPKEWSIFTVRYEPPDDPAIFVNGVSSGAITCAATDDDQAVGDGVVMNVGRETQQEQRGGEILIMNLDVCTSALSKEDITNHAGYVTKIITNTKSKGFVHHLTITLFFITSALAVYFM